MRRAVGSALVALALLAGTGAPVSAQQQSAPATPGIQEEFGIIAPNTTREATRAREQEFYPGEDIRVRHEPAFVRGMSSAPASGPIKRYGVSGWTSPPGRGDGITAHETSGWFGFGFSLIWE
jgi:hypothetical protein